MAKKKKIRKENKKRKKILKEGILTHGHKINLNNLIDREIKFNMLSTRFINYKTETPKNIFQNNLINLKRDELNLDPIKTKKYKILFTEKQKKIINSWMDGYIDIYNSIIYLIKCEFKKKLEENKNFKLINLKVDLNISKLKKQFSDKKKQIIKSTKINSHILDYAICDAVAMFKSKVSNLRNGHIKKSKLRYLRKTKSNKIIKIENHLCSNNSFSSKIMGNTVKTFPQINFKNDIKIVGIVQYKKSTKEYYLLVRDYTYKCIKNDIREYVSNNEYEYNICNELNGNIMCLKVLQDVQNMNHSKTYNPTIIWLQKRIRELEKEKKNKYIPLYKKKISSSNRIVSLDPGIRVFLTGISDDHSIEYGVNLSDIVEYKIKHIDHIQCNSSIFPDRKKKIVDRLKNNLSNLIDDFHWKITNNIVKNYKHVLIGNMSSKSIGEGNIGKMLKRISKCFKFYVFKGRLKYKCFLNGVKYYHVDEYGTSKYCSNCAYYHVNLGSSKIYNCPSCHMCIDRDINAAKNILIRSII